VLSGCVLLRAVSRTNSPFFYFFPRPSLFSFGTKPSHALSILIFLASDLTEDGLFSLGPPTEVFAAPSPPLGKRDRHRGFWASISVPRDRGGGAVLFPGWTRKGQPAPLPFFSFFPSLISGPPGTFLGVQSSFSIGSGGRGSFPFLSSVFREGPAGPFRFLAAKRRRRSVFPSRFSFLTAKKLLFLLWGHGHRWAGAFPPQKTYCFSLLHFFFFFCSNKAIFPLPIYEAIVPLSFFAKFLSFFLSL